MISIKFEDILAIATHEFMKICTVQNNPLFWCSYTYGLLYNYVSNVHTYNCQ